MTEHGAARLTPYVSRVVLEWAASTPEKQHRRLEGTLAFCDLSGFTAMSEKLAALGRLGAEELADILNGIFAALLADAASFGGSLLKYGGDALLLFFDGEDHAERGAAATHHMRATLRRQGRVRTSQGTVQIRMSVGLHTGSFDFFLVGESHRELVVAGAGATECCAMETAADAGEILLSPTTAASLARTCIGEAKGRGFLLRRAPRIAPSAPLPVPGADIVDPTPYVPASLRAHLGDVGVDAEHRHIAVGFVGFNGLDSLIVERGGDEVAQLLDRFIASCQRAFEAYGCTFLYVDVYGDGGKVFFIVGAPVAHEDNEERALRACRSIHSQPYDGLHLHTGVNRGYVFAGDVGATFRRTYTVLGDAVNTAARVMASCTEDGQVRVLPEVLQMATSRYEAAEQPPFAAKGKTKPIVSYAVGEPLGPRTADLPLPLVGREDELARLHTQVVQAHSGTAVAVNVIGEAGVGKSRLVAELCDRLRAQPGWTVSVAYGERYEQANSFIVIRRLLEGLVGIDSDLYRRVDAALTDSSDVPAITPVLLDVLRSLPGALLFVIENADLADAASNELIEAVAIGAVGRPWALVRVGRAIATQADDIVLDHLSSDAATQLALLADPTLLPYDASEIAQRSNGNPLFLRQLVAAKQAGAEFGDSIETTIATRIDTLAPRERDVLRTAAVLGGRFELRALAALVDKPVDYAALGDFLTTGSGYGIFRQALYRDVAYEGLTFRRRRGLHLAAGRMLEAAQSDDIGRLSLHFHNAQAWQESWTYSRAAAKHAYSTAAKATAITFYERAAEAGRRLRDLPRAEVASVFALLGQSLYYAGRVDEARSAYAAGRRFAPRDSIQRAELESREAVSYHSAGDAVRAVRWYKRSLTTLQSVPEPLEETAAEVAVTGHIGISNLAARRGHVAQAMDALDKATAIANRSGVQSLLGRVHGLGTMLAFASGDVAEARAAARRSLDAYRADGRFPGSIAVAASNLGTLEQQLGNWAEASVLLREACEAQLASGNAALAAEAQANLAELLIDQGRWDDARVEVAEADRVLRLVGSENVVFTEHVQRRLRIRTGQPDPGASPDQLAALATLGLADECTSLDVEAALARGDRGTARSLLEAIDQSDERLFAAQCVATGRELPLSFDALHPLSRVVIRVLRGGKVDADPEALDLGIVDVPQWAQRQ